MSENPKKPEKIEVDKDFLMTVLKKVEGIGKEVSEMKQETFKPEAPAQEISPNQEYIFQIIETYSLNLGRIPTPQDILGYKQRSDEFRGKLEALMKEYKVVQATAMFLKKL